MSLPSRQSALYFASFVATGMVLAALGPALPSLARQTGVEINAISILFVALNLGVLMGTIASGRRFDRWPAHPFMAAMMAIMAITVALAPAPGSLVILAIVLFTYGLGKGGIDVASNTALVWVQGAGVGPYLNALHFFFGLGALISPTLVAVVLDRTGGVAGAYWLMALAIAPLFFLFLRTPSPPPPPAMAGVAARHVPWAPVVMTATLFFLYVGVEVGYSGLVFSYATRLGLAVTVTAGYLTSLFWACITLGRLLTIPPGGPCAPALPAVGRPERHSHLPHAAGCVAGDTRGRLDRDHWSGLQHGFVLSHAALARRAPSAPHRSCGGLVHGGRRPGRHDRAVVAGPTLQCPGTPGAGAHTPIPGGAGGCSFRRPVGAFPANGKRCTLAGCTFAR